VHANLTETINNEKHSYLLATELVIAISSCFENNLINSDYLSGLMNTSAGRVDSIAYKESLIIFKKQEK